jgi:lysophospholipase L1-like esterase
MFSLIIPIPVVSITAAPKVSHRPWTAHTHRRLGNRARRALIALATVVSMSCGGSNPVTPDPPGPVIACPANMQALARNNQAPVVNFQNPVAQGGIAPVSVSCSPKSGTAFPVGTNTVTCTATDAKSRATTCSFLVVVAAVPRLSELKFLAFGDSITEGKVSPDPTTLMLNFPASYPNKLQALLSRRYIDQTIRVIPEGKGGEEVATDGKKRFPSVLDKYRPDVVLLLHGANDLLSAGGSGDPFDAIPSIVGALEDMIGIARRRRVEVMLATFPPQDVDGSRGAGAPAVPRLNRALARLAVREDAVLVDLFAGLGGTPIGSIGVDGLHPTATGYTKIAQIWFEAIQREYEQPAASGIPTLRVTRTAVHTP